MTTIDISHNFRVTRGYTTSRGDGDTEVVWFFETSHEAFAAAKSEARTLRVIDRNGCIITEDVLVEELDADLEPIGQPIFWVKADDVIVEAELEDCA